MSKVCIITPRSINDSPCLEKYKDIIQGSFDIIFWSKGEQKELCGATNYYSYNGVVPVEGAKLSKIKHYYLFSRFIRKVVKSNKYDKLILYPTHISWLLLDLLVFRYKNSYVLDIRDYAGENNRIIKSLTSCAVRNAALCSITSPSYKQFLPNDVDYIISHNIQHIDSEMIEQYRLRKRSLDKPIVISFIGTVRFIEQQKKFLDVFGNDKRFLIKYIGRGSEALTDYCLENHINNVELIGQFERTELGKHYLNTDFALNIYGNDNPALVYALSNKLYSATLMGMPILCSPYTFTETIVDKYNIGLSVNLDDNDSPDRVYAYHQSLDYTSFVYNCDVFINSILKDEMIYKQTVSSFINN